MMAVDPPVEEEVADLVLLTLSTCLQRAAEKYSDGIPSMGITRGVRGCEPAIFMAAPTTAWCSSTTLIYSLALTAV